MAAMEPALLVALALLGAGLVAAAIVLAARRAPAALDLAMPLQPLMQAVTAVQVELRGLSERVLTLEQRQSRLDQGLAGLGTGLAETGSVAKGLVDATASIREGLARTAQDLTTLQTYARARHELEQRTADSIRRLEAVIAGSQSKGAAGENILDVVFARLPAEWQVRNFRVGDRVVEFGLRLPNNLILPIDSKWAATELLEQFASCEEPAEQQQLKREIEAAVLGRAKEVRKYLDPALTAGFGVAAVPDAAYDLCAGILAELFQANVVLVSYSLFVPYLLLVFQTALKTSRQIDLQKLDGYLRSVQGSLAALQEELDGRFARALTMLQNSRAEMGAHLGKVAGGLTGLRLGGEVGVAKIDSGAGAGQPAPDCAGDGQLAAGGAVSSIVVTSDAPSVG